jgi:hypothetical protein
MKTPLKLSVSLNKFIISIMVTLKNINKKKKELLKYIMNNF